MFTSCPPHMLPHIFGSQSVTQYTIKKYSFVNELHDGCNFLGNQGLIRNPLLFQPLLKILRKCQNPFFLHAVSVISSLIHSEHRSSLPRPVGTAKNDVGY